MNRPCIYCLKTIASGAFWEEHIATVKGELSFSDLFRVRLVSKVMLDFEKVPRSILEDELKTRSELSFPFLEPQLAAFQNHIHYFHITPVYCLSFGNFLSIFRATLYTTGIRSYVASIVLTLKYLHKKGKPHMNVNFSNIFIDLNGHIKLGYRFASQWIDPPGVEKLPCDPHANYKKWGSTAFAYAVDFWCLGMMLYEFYFCRLPDGYYLFDLETRASIDPAEFFCEYYVDPQITSLIELLLGLGRPDTWLTCAEDIDVVMAHPYFSLIDFDAIESLRFKPEVERKLVAGASYSILALGRGAPLFVETDDRKDMFGRAIDRTKDAPEAEKDPIEYSLNEHDTNMWSLRLN